MCRAVRYREPRLKIELSGSWRLILESRMSCSSVDGLKIGDKVLFRLHERHYLNGRLTLMAIPYADNPNKEVEFSTQFVPDVALSQLTRPKDNVKGLAIRSSCHQR